MTFNLFHAKFVIFPATFCDTSYFYCFSGLEAFSLDYVVKWPLSLILSKKVFPVSHYFHFFQVLAF